MVALHAHERDGRFHGVVQIQIGKRRRQLHATLIVDTAEEALELARAWAEENDLGPVGESVSASLRVWRRSRGLSQEGLARLLGLPEAGGQVTVSRWEAGDQKPAPYLGLALAELERRLTSGG
jgi:DNA-binding transcriptional regulator YiaG